MSLARRRVITVEDDGVVPPGLFQLHPCHRQRRKRYVHGRGNVVAGILFRPTGIHQEKDLPSVDPVLQFACRKEPDLNGDLALLGLPLKIWGRSAAGTNNHDNDEERNRGEYPHPTIFVCSPNGFQCRHLRVKNALPAVPCPRGRKDVRCDLPTARTSRTTMLDRGPSY